MVGVELQVLPSGFSLPPTPYLVGLVLGVLIVSVLLLTLRPPVRSWEVLALGTWMGVGGTFHAMHQLALFPSWASPLFGAPAVYATTFVVAGGLWLFAAFGEAAGVFSSAPRIIGVTGGTVLFLLVAFLVHVGIAAGTLAPFWPALGLFVSVLVAAFGVIALSLVKTESVAATGHAGVLVVFGHTLDGVTTAIGVDVLGVGERTPLPRLIIGLAEDLPTAEFLGTGWLFVLTKVVLALLVVVVFADYVDESPSQGNAALALLTGVGLGPGVYNLLLFLVAAPITVT